MKNSSLCYIEKDNKTLFIHRNKKENDVHRGRYIGLGGKFESGESPEECIVREIKEESGLSVTKPILRGILTFPKFKDEEDWYVFLYTVNEFAGELQECNEGDLIWVNNDEILKLNMSEGDKLFLKWLREHEFFSAKLEYKNNQLMNYSLTVYK